MIFGIGTDIVQIPRIERILEKYGNIFSTKILCSTELQKLELLPLDKHSNFLAKRFAAKEAISKAFGIGITKHNLHFKDITILNDNLGKPYTEINLNKLKDFGIFKINLSISDDYPVAIAFAVITLL